MHVQDVLPRDAIPGIDDPVFGADYFGDPGDEVIVLEATPARAYPVRILSHHEIVNDLVDRPERRSPEQDGVDDPTRRSVPVAVTWCPICASAAVYDRRVGDRVLTFGTSGTLADDALVMYDRETESEWKQPSGRAIDGPVRGRTLSVMPASMMVWQRFRASYPEGLVLQPVHGDEGDPRAPSPRAAYEMTPYDRYDAADGFGLHEMRGWGPERSWDRTDIAAKTRVLGVSHDGDAVGYPLPQLQAADGVVTDTVGGLDVLVASTEGHLHAFEDPGYDVERRNGTLFGDGVAWDASTGRSEDGRSLSRVPSRRLSAFAWQDDHGPERFYGLG